MALIPKTSANDYAIRTWETDDGLPLSAITDVTQTPDGYLWVGTLLGGPCRFDGVRFVGLDSTNVPELRSWSSIRRLFVDSRGVMWINTYNNTLVSYDEGKFHLDQNRDCRLSAIVYSDEFHIVFSSMDGHLLCATINSDGTYAWINLAPPGSATGTSFYEDQTGHIWYRQQDGRLRCIASDANAKIVPKYPLNEPATTLFASPTHEIWVGTSRHLLRWSGSSFENVTPTNGEPNVSVSRLFFSANGDLWVEGNSRLRRWQAGCWTAEVKNWGANGLQGINVRLMKGDNEGGLWLVMTSAGLIHIRADGAIERPTEQEGEAGSVVRCLFNDREGNLWVGYERGGLARIRPRYFQVVGKPEGLTDSAVSSVCEDAAGALWIGTINGSLARWQNGVCTNFNLPLKGKSSQYLVASPDQQGRLWVGTSGNGLLVYENGEFHHALLPNQLNLDVRLLLPARDGRVWIAGLSSLLCYQNGAVTKLLDSHSSLDYPAALAETSDGKLWMGTFGGDLRSYDGTRWTTFRPKDYYGVPRFWAMAAEPSGTIWIGTSGAGLIRFRDGEFRRFTTADGLPSENISQIIADNSGHLWLGTRAGITEISEAEIERYAKNESKYIPCRLFNRNDGLRSTSCAFEFQPLCWEGRDGWLWFGMANGVAGIMPELVTASHALPDVLIEEVLLDGVNLDLPAQSSKDLSRIVKIQPGQHELELHYTVPSFVAPESLRFRYQLEGLEDSWHAGVATRSVVYRYAPPGHYTFRVQACNSDGVWSEHETRLGIIILPYFWQTRWFPFAVTFSLVLIASLIVALVMRARQRRRLAHVEQLRSIERERTRVAQDLHDELGAGLAQIGLLGSLAQRPAATSGRMQEHLQQITGKSRELITALDEIVWAVNPKHDSAASLSSYFCRYAQEFLRPTTTACRLDVAKNLPALALNSSQRHNFFLAFKEALANVVHHAQASEIWLRIGNDEREFWVTVEDNGKGMGTASASEGSDGLQNMSERLKNLGGRCEVGKAPGGGTAIKFILPING
jgi:signal transduction histidine kinase/ligand-binding sensor domain-containing protein